MFGCVSRPSVDFTAHLNFTPHLRATLEGLNITNQRIVQYTDIPSHRIEVSTSSGRTILWGMTYEY